MKAEREQARPVESHADARRRLGLPVCGWVVDHIGLDEAHLDSLPDNASRNEYLAGLEVRLTATAPHPTAEGWTVSVDLEHRDGEVVATRYSIDCPSGEPIRRAPMMGRLGLGKVGELVAEDIKTGFAKNPRLAGWADSFLAIPRVGRGTRPDRPYAEVAARYVEALQLAPKAPIRHMLEAEGIEVGGGETESSLRAKLNRARARGLLTAAPPGKPGGELTDKARRLLGMED